MAYRITIDELKEIIETDRSDPVLDAFISPANQLVTEILGTSLEDSKLKEIERWLAAHFLKATLDRQVRSEGADKANVAYEGTTGMGLDGTTYGQTVKLLDSTGKLAASVGKKKAELTAVTSFVGKNAF